MRTRRKLWRAYLLGFVLGAAWAIDWAGAQDKAVSGQISRISDTTHLEFRGLSQWDYALKRVDPKKWLLTVPAFSAATVTQLASYRDGLIERVEVNPSGPDGKFEVTFHMARTDIESFDYLTDDPSRLILDFYQDQPPSAVAAEVVTPAATTPTATKPRVAKKPAAVTADGYVKKEPARKPAGSEILEASPEGELEANPNSLRFQQGLFDSGDPKYNRFTIKDHEIREEAIIASRQNIYIRFPMLKLPSTQLKELLDNPPEYEIQPKDTRENKEARLLKTLYDKGRSAAFLKTYAFFTKRFPDSVYDEIVRNMAAEILYKLWQKEGRAEDYAQAKNLYLYLLDKYPDSVLRERNELLLAYTETERGNALETIQRFERFIEQFPNSDSIDWARKSLADGYLALNKFDDALRVYGDLEKSGRDRKASAEGSYRMGDVHFARKDYEKALGAYQKAIREKPDFQNDFPNAWYNMAESDFWLGRHKDSLNNYLEYVRRFPADTHGGYALTRIGELLEILGADTSRTMGAFLESYFRFRGSEGANVARVRMLSQRMKVMKDKELKKAIEEMDQIVATSNLPKIREFITLMVADGYHRRAEYAKALSELVTYYQGNPNSANLEFFRSRILRNITDSIRQEVVAGRFMEALNLNSKYAGTWLRRADRMDIPYLVGTAFEQAGVVDEAERVYGATLSGLTRIQGTQEEKERRVNEYLPTLESLRLRLASVATKKRKYGEAYGHLAQIKDVETLSSEEQVERVELGAQLAVEKGELGLAKNYLRALIQTWKESPELLAPVYLRLADLQAQTQEFEDARKSIEFLEAMRKAEPALGDDLWLKALQLKGDVLNRQGKTASAVETYLKLLEEFEEKRPLQSVRYKTGQLLFEKGDLKGAEKIWSALREDGGALYKKLAAEKMSHASWQDDYKRYIQRIPAAADIKQE